MKRIFVPTKSPVNWKDLLADPDMHWKELKSAMTLALSWEAAIADGFPPEVRVVLDSSDCVGFRQLKLLLALPEYKTALPGGGKPSQTDVMVIAKGYDGLVAMAVEGKVDESFGPTMGEKRAEKSEGIKARLEFLHKALSFSEPVPDDIRYQFLSRTVSALIAAKEFDARLAIMLVQSFSRENKWFDDFTRFVHLFGPTPSIGQLSNLGEFHGIRLYAGWCKGDERYLELGEGDGMGEPEGEK